MTSYAVSILAKLPADYGKAAPVGLFVILALGIIVVFLVRSMNKHVKRVPRAFGAAGAPPSAAADDGTTASDLAASATAQVELTASSGTDEPARDERPRGSSAPIDPA